MAKLVNIRRRGHTAVPNFVLQRPDMSLRAKGLLCLMLSFPDNWEYNLAHLSSLSSDGKHATREAFKELQMLRYVERYCKREGGKFQCIYIVSDSPMPVGEAERFMVTGRL